MLKFALSMGYSKDWRTGREADEIRYALTMLPFLAPEHGSTGESFAARSGTAFKRVLMHRIAEYMRPASYLETHAGYNVATNYVLYNSPACKIVSCRHWETEVDAIQGEVYDLIDVDPFGCPLDALRATRRLQHGGSVVLATSGTITRQFRGWAGGPSGIDAVNWAEGELKAQVEEAAGLLCVFMYSHPQMCRFVLSSIELPRTVFDRIPTRLGKFAHAK